MHQSIAVSSSQNMYFLQVIIIKNELSQRWVSPKKIPVKLYAFGAITGCRPRLIALMRPDGDIAVLLERINRRQTPA